MHRAIYWPLKFPHAVNLCRKDVEPEHYSPIMQMLDIFIDVSDQYCGECPPDHSTYLEHAKPLKTSFGGAGISHLYVRSGRFKTPVLTRPLVS